MHTMQELSRLLTHSRGDLLRNALCRLWLVPSIHSTGLLATPSLHDSHSSRCTCGIHTHASAHPGISADTPAADSAGLQSSSTHDHTVTSSSSSSSNAATNTSSSSSSNAATNTSSSSSSRPSSFAAGTFSSLDKREAAKFAALADKWWDTSSGPFAALHALNTARCSFLRQGLCDIRGLNPDTAEPLAGLRVLDVGCGGGLLSEPLARMGAQVTGIDVAAEGVAAAAAHAAGDPLLKGRITYKQSTPEDLVAGGDSCFDVVMASEVIEHVKRPQQFMASLAAATAPGGQVFITTLNRTPASYALAILGAEYLLRLVPQGTHSWTKFITPQELAMMARDAGLELQLMAGMVLQPSSGQFSLSDRDVAVNYAALLLKSA